MTRILTLATVALLFTANSANAQTLTPPVISLPSGAYAPGTAVTISHDDAAATIRFTLNGADPTGSDATIASGGTLLVGGYTLKVRAFKAGAIDSAAASAVYSLTEPYSGGAVAADEEHNVIATPQGLVYAWGKNSWNQLGDGTTTNRSTPTLVPLTGVVATAAGVGHTLAATADGRLFVWGANWYGQLGDGGTAYRSWPTQIATVPDVLSVAAGDGHSLALTAAGAVYAWGQNTYGQLGLGSTSNQSTPIHVPGLSNVIAIAAGASHSVAVTVDGRVFAWGYNWWGQVGDGTTTNRLSPVQVAVSGVVDVAAGGDKSVALAADGRVVVWGDIRLDTGTSTISYVPFAVPNLQAIDIAAGRDHTLALRADGVLMAWGVNSSGQLGDGTTTHRWSPVVVAGVSNAADMAAGRYHTIAVTKDGHIWTWGYGGSGQLGGGSTASHPTPQDVFTVGGTWGRTPMPTLSIPPGTYHSTQTVTVSNLRADAVMRYTTNGAVPTETDPIIANGQQLSVTAPITFNFGAWSPDLFPSRVLTAVYDLRPAVAVTPPGGFYPGAQTVTIATTPSDSVTHYTLDGTDPTESSAIYTDPVAISSGTTLKARAFRSGWNPSDIATAVYAFDPTPPTISAQVSPAPGPSGWHTSSGVTVTFTCSDNESPITFCSSSVQFTGEAVDEVTGYATNATGLSSSVTVAVRVDLYAPSVNVYTPEPVDVYPPGTTTVLIRGGALDSASGVQSVMCGATAGTVSNQAYACAVPVVDGSNVFTITATDAVGRTGSREISILVAPPPPPTVIEISPATLTMIGGETRRVTVTDERNRIVTGGAWTVDQPLVAQVEEVDGVTMIRALAAGTAVITVTRDGLTANATVTVLAAGSSIPSGTTLWSLVGTTTPPRGEVLRAAPGEDDNPDTGTALFFVDEGAELHPTGLVRRWNRPTRLRATTVDGRQLWDRQFTDRIPIQVTADPRGGLVLVFGSEICANGDYCPGLIRRLYGRTGDIAWEYVVERLTGTFSEVAIHPDGTVYTTEYPYYGTRVYLTGIGVTGSVQRWPLPRGSYSGIGSDGRATSGFTEPWASGSIVREDGSVVLVSTRRYWTDSTYDAVSDLFVLTEAGVLEQQPLNLSALLALDPKFTLDAMQFRLLPDGAGGLLLGQRDAAALYRIDPDRIVTGRIYVDNGTYHAEYVLGEDGVYIMVLQSGFGYSARAIAVNPITLASTSSAFLGPGRPEPKQLQLRFALAGGGVYVSGPAEAYAVNATVDASAFGAGGNATQMVAGIWTGWSSGPAIAVGDGVGFATTLWNQPRGGQTARATNAASDNQRGIFAKGHPVLGFSHVAIKVVPTDPDYWIQRFPGIFKDRDGNDIKDERGNYFFTIGAGPNSEGCVGQLVSDRNRPRDVTAPPDNPSQPEKLQYPPTVENDLIERLMIYDQRYPDNLLYGCFPNHIDGTYNSNSYAVGLLRKAGIPEPAFPYWYWPRYVGWTRPVPTSAFD